MSREAGEPTRKNASWSQPPSMTSFSRSLRPNSSATAERFGESRFWSAYRNIAVRVSRTTA